MHSSPQGHSALRAHSRHCLSERASRRRSLEASLRLSSVEVEVEVLGVCSSGSSSSAAAAVVVVIVVAFSSFSSKTEASATAVLVFGGGSQNSRLTGQMTVKVSRESVFVERFELEFFSIDRRSLLCKGKKTKKKRTLREELFA